MPSNKRTERNITIGARFLLKPKWNTHHTLTTLSHCSRYFCGIKMHTSYHCLLSAFQLILLQQLHQRQFNFQEGKSHADTVTRTVAERHVSIRMTLCFVSFRKSAEENKVLNVLHSNVRTQVVVNEFTIGNLMPPLNLEPLVDSKSHPKENTDRIRKILPP